MRTTTFAILGVLFLAVNRTKAQTNQGKDFWLAETLNIDCKGITIVIVNPSVATASAVIDHPSSATITPVTVAAGGLEKRTFPCRASQSTGTSDLPVYHVTSDIDVVVYIFNPLDNVYTNDASLILPVLALGKKHRLGTYYTSRWSLAATFSVVAVEDNTLVTSFNNAGVQVDTVTINKGQQYQRVQNADMTAWSVVTSKNAVVFAGSRCTGIGSLNACDHLEEQVIPEEALSSTYITCPSLTRPIGCTAGVCAPDHFRYVATEDNTVITTSPAVVGGTINKGEFLMIDTSVPHVVVANKPIYGYQYLVSQEAGGAGTGDPSLLSIPPINQFLFSYTFLTPDTYAFNFINVVAPVGISLVLDGVPLDVTCDPVGDIDGTSYCCAQKQIGVEGAHTITGNQQFGLSVTGFDQYASYGYLGGLGLQHINAGCDTGGPYQKITCTVCGPLEVQLEGSPSCFDASTPTVFWSSPNGVTFSNTNVADPIATVPDFGVFQICKDVTCGSEDAVRCCSSIEIIEQTEGCNTGSSSGGKGCTDDVTLIYMIGETSYEEVPISIIRQDTWTVTFEISHQWEGMDSLNLFTHYVDPMNGLLVCLNTENFKKDDDMPLQLTAGCMTPDATIAVVHLVAVHDDLGEGDIATPPKCCDYGGSDPNAAAVQYTFTLQCVPKLCPPTPPVEPPSCDDPSISPSSPPPVERRCIATGWGDPHFVTFDGIKYDCQADGEVVLIRSFDSDFEIQGRFTKTGFPAVTTGVVIREREGLPIVQISMATVLERTPNVAGCPVELYVDDVARDLEEGTGLSNVEVAVIGNSINVLYPSTGTEVIMTVSVFRGVCYFSVDYKIPDDLCLGSEQIVGILGTPNGDPTDDWMSRNGTTLPIPSSASALIFEPAFNYCTENWCIRDEVESLFTYETGKTFDDFENCDGSYDASLETDVANAPQCLKDFCDLDTGCIIDGLTLGKGAAVEYSQNNAVSNNTCIPSPPKSCYYSCADALETTCDSLAGLYSICPSVENNETFTVYCDQETNGGGWMLLYSYNHAAGENDELAPGVIPQNPEEAYSHISVNNIPGYTEADIESVRFYCTSSAHERLVHFTNDHPFVKGMAFDGNQIGNQPQFWNDECFSSDVSGHTGIIPAQVDLLHGDWIFTETGGLHSFPFYKGFGNHWGIRALDPSAGRGFRWECDDMIVPPLYEDGLSTATLHNVWVRMAPSPPRAPSVIIGQLFNTGVDATGAAIGFGMEDPHYSVVENDNAPAVNIGRPYSIFFPNNAYSTWIWQMANGGPTFVTRTFETSFDLTGYDVTSAKISGVWGTDNFGLDILINSVSTGITSPTFTMLTPFTIDSGFVAGQNVLQFVVQDVGAVAGFRVDNIVLTAVPIVLRH